MNAQQMSCSRALLILIDQPEGGSSRELLTARLHAARCPRCNLAYDPSARDAVTRSLATQRAEPASALRVGLLTIAVVQLVLAIPWALGKSLLPDSHVAVAHLTRDGALGLIVASLGIVTAWRPRYVHSTRLIGIVVLGLQLVTGIADQQMSSVTSSFEFVHFLVVIIVLGLFAIAADIARRSTPCAEPKPRMLHATTPTHREPRTYRNLGDG